MWWKTYSGPIPLSSPMSQTPPPTLGEGEGLILSILLSLHLCTPNLYFLSEVLNISTVSVHELGTELNVRTIQKNALTKEVTA